MMESIYRNAVLPFFEGVVKRRPIFRYSRDLESSQWWSARELQQWQLQRLRDLLLYCQQHSRYYRELWARTGLDPRSIRRLDDFYDRWPVTSRETMKESSNTIQSDDARLRTVQKATGGSSGAPLQFSIDTGANDRRVAAAYRGYTWAGAGPGTRQTHLWGVNLQAVSRWRRCKEWLYSRGLHRRDVINSFRLSDQTVASIVRRINRFRPKVLVAYTHPLYDLARIIDREHLDVRPPQAIIVGAEKLHSFQRTLIERVFAAPVFETYGSREFTLIGAECENHNGLHTSAELLLVEITDDAGHPVEPGTEGNIVITDLFNVATPFIRYAIGDRGIAEPGDCACGRGLPRLKTVVGRQLEMIVTPDGRRIPGEFFPHVIKDFSAVRQFQVVQTRPDQVDIKLVVAADWTDGDQQTLRDRVHRGLGDSRFETRIRRVDSIPLTTAGKRRVVIGYTGSLDGTAA